METTKKYTAFVGERLVASGALEELLPKLKATFDLDRSAPFLIFDDETGEQVDFVLQGPHTNGCDIAFLGMRPR